MNYLILEIPISNIQYTQHQIGQMNLILRQELNEHMSWTFRTEE